MTIACVLRSGGLYDHAWVDALERQVVQHAPKGATFRALVDAHPWPGWWAKIGLLDPEHFTGLVLALDLDTDVVGPLDWALGYSGEFALLSDFYRPRLAQSGVMLFRAGPGTFAARLYRRFTEDAERWMARYRGDGEWLHAHAPHADRLQDLFPGKVLSHKVHDRPSLVCFHGEPKRWPDGVIRNSNGRAA